MVNIFDWDPVLDQTYDADYSNAELTSEVTYGQFPSNCFYKKDADFTLAADSTTDLKLLVDASVSDTRTHINWTSSIYGKSINIVNGALSCRGAPVGANYVGTTSALISGSTYNCLSLNVDGQLIFDSYEASVIEGVNVHVRNNGSLQFKNNNYVTLVGAQDKFDTAAVVVVDDEARFIADSNKGIFIHNLHFNVASEVDDALYLKSIHGSVEFNNYDYEDTRGIHLRKNSKTQISGLSLKINNAKITCRNNSSIIVQADNLLVGTAGRFTLSDKAIIAFEGLTRKDFLLTGSTAASYPTKLFSFNTSSGEKGGYYKFYGLDSGAGLNLLLAFGLLSVDGITSENILRNKLYFQDMMDGSNKYLKIGLI